MGIVEFLIWSVCVFLCLYFVANSHIFGFILTATTIPQGSIKIFAYIPGAIWAIQNFFMHFCPGTMTTHAESINSDLQTFTTHTTLNTEQKQLAIKLPADN